MQLKRSFSDGGIWQNGSRDLAWAVGILSPLFFALAFLPSVCPALGRSTPSSSISIEKEWKTGHNDTLFYRDEASVKIPGNPTLYNTDTVIRKGREANKASCG